MGDPHGNVVRHHGEVVDGGAVAPEDHEVVEVVPLEADPPMDRVVPGEFSVGHADTHGGFLAGGEAAGGLVGRDGAAAAVVTEAGLLGGGSCPLGVEFRPGAEAVVGLARVQQLPDVGLVLFEVCALEEGALVPGDAEPGEAVEDHLGVGVGAPLPVGILDPQHHRAAGLPGVQPVEERGAGAANVEIPGRGWGEADAGH